MSPTPRGAELAEAAREMLRQVDDKLKPDTSFDPSGAHRPFTFALSDVGEIVFLPKLVRECGKASPGTAVRSVSLRPDKLAEALQEGEVDLAVGYFPDLKQGSYFFQRLLTHHFVCLLRKDHPIQGSRLTLTEFLGLPHAVVRSEGRSQEIFESFLEARGLSRRIVLYTPHFLSIPKLIARSDMVVTVPHAVGVEYGKESFGLKIMNPPFPAPKIDLRQHWHRKVHRDARNVWLRQMVSGLFNKASDEW